MTDGFYRAFEERHRGLREVIKARMSAYLPFIQGLQELGRELQALDLGCGRGEWLELLAENSVNVQGVDQNEGMLQACLDRELNVVRKDALEYLKQQSDGSFDIVSAFHFVEHIPFASLQTLVKEALRVLKPAGLLIMETPNPDNVVVGASGFYMDPTHTQPIPAPLLAFLTEYQGYARQKVLGLQEPESVRSDDHIGLRDVLFHVSPDYAVVAQAPANEEALAVLDAAFEQEYGRSLGELCQRFDQGLGESFEMLRDRLDRSEGAQSDMAIRIARTESLASEIAALRAEAGEHKGRAEALQSELETAHTRTERLESALATVQSRVEQLSCDLSDRDRELETTQSHIELLRSDLSDKNDAIASAQAALEEQQAHGQWLQNEWNAATVKIDELNKSAHRWWQTAESLNTELQAVYRSKSWRVTWPLRKAMVLVKWLLRLPIRFASAMIHLSKVLARWFVAKAIAFVLRRDGLKWRAFQWVNRHSRLKQRLKALVRDRGLISAQNDGDLESTASGSLETSEYAFEPGDDDNEMATLTPNAKAIYKQLKGHVDDKDR
ncbi:O-antigen chain-terminating methyltransferase [Methylohalomonas lacus]|uniref:O-antigen chain-terminating methyltransferase n=1 Tax=Methylohalomonas lacus TaxID=398773 RepID=A0AAE3HLX6_9GAMM|nr:methyltransferase domain-containing protein [Methylohalomonas lacus]MCS3903569.1 O-antigen chain-terminating methyltransferase [Methylohalomonas lacus]